MTTKNAFLFLPFLLVLTAACAGTGTLSPGPLAGAASLAPQTGAAAASARPAPDPAVAESVGRELAMLRGVRGDDQLRTLRWMLAVSDDRRLVNLFDDTRGPGEEGLDRRAATARQRLEDLATRLEAAGHRAPDPAGLEVARSDPNAPPPNWFPPALIEELAARPNDPVAAQALEEARRTAPRGSRPPG
jgi:hypothetical protein